MRIYTRNGILLFQSKGYTVPWDGLFDTKQLPASTYYYVLNLGSGAVNNVVSGYITIVR